MRYARFEQHYHIVTLWSSLTPIMAIMIRHTLFENVWLFIVVNFRAGRVHGGRHALRLPACGSRARPAVPGQSRLDNGKPPYGEFGEWMCKTFSSPFARVTITVLMLVWYNVVPVVVTLYLFFFDCVDPSERAARRALRSSCAPSACFTRGSSLRNTRLQLLGLPPRPHAHEVLVQRLQDGPVRPREARRRHGRRGSG